MDGQRSEVTELTTEEDLRTLAHPIRMRLLGILRTDGPSTASKLAVRIGESSGTTSYHLRRLATAGFIEEVKERGTRRERWWQAAQRITSYSPATFIDSPGAHRTLASMRREILRWQHVVSEQYLAEEVEWGADWADAAGNSDLVLHLSPARLRSMTEEIMETVERYWNDPTPAEDEEGADVLVLFNAFPFRDLLL